MQKSLLPFSRFGLLSAKATSGAALVVVLSCLVLVAVVVVAFLAASTTERGASRSFAEGGRARLLAQSAMDIVQGQIWAATTQTNTSWASQPGALRTFAPGSTNFVNVYKLYSSDTMVADGSFTAGTTNAPAEIPADWASRPNQFVDLNLPVTNAAGLNFPILDPRAKDFANPTNSVAGFDFNSSRGATETSLPMPVQWLYQLQDGTLEAMDSSGKVANATAANPIVGRIAFWTDDDTCKININTAGEGVFWDVPRGNGVGGLPESDINFARYQPAQHEFQRYPGHPFQISLKAVFPELLADEIYALTPRVLSDDTGSNVSDPDPANWKRPTGPMGLKTERLYASLDELLFRQIPNSGLRETNPPPASITPQALSRLNSFVTAYNRAPELNLFGKPRISMWPVNVDPTKRTAVDKWFARCATIGGRMYNVQRSNPTSPTNDYDNIPDNIRLYGYLKSMTAQVPPGFAASFQSKYGVDMNQTLAQAMDYIRCVNLVDTSTGAIPFGISNSTASLTGTTFNAIYGFGQAAPLKIEGNRGLGRHTTISEIGFLVFPMTWSKHPTDYNAVNVAQWDSNVNGKVKYGDWADFAKTLNGDPVRLGEEEWPSPPIFRQRTNSSWGGTTLPIRTLQSVPPLVMNPVTNDDWKGWGRIPENPPMYRLVLLLEPVQPASGYVQYNPDYKYRIEGLDTLRVDGQPVGFPQVVTETVQGMGGIIGGYSDSIRTAMLGWADGFTGASGPKFPYDTKNNQVTAMKRDFFLISPPFPISGPLVGGKMTPSPTFNLSSSGGIVITVLSKDDDPIQTINFRVNSLTLPTPDPENYRSITSSKGGQYVALGRRERIQWIQASGGNEFFCPDDTVVSLEAAGIYSDSRLLMAQNEVDENAYQPHANISSSTKRAHSFRRDLVASVDGNNATFGNHVQDLALDPAYKPDIPSTQNGVFNALNLPGDFDTGPGQSLDGAFFNKPDEGNAKFSGTPYFNVNGFSNQAALGFDTYFAPNRQVPSPGMFGSLPSRAKTLQPWETLLFNPNPAASNLHRGFGRSRPDGVSFTNGQDPPDYLLLDLFNMPIVEPYAISEPFSTAGKVNMNIQMVPFTYIHRSTALQALFAANRVAAFHNNDSTRYKAGSTALFRHKINSEETLKQWDEVFAKGNIFKSAGEICAMDLYPMVTAQNVPANTPVDQPVYDPQRNSIMTWWSNRRITGDNMREQPYTNLYQNLTTQSNTYTIHVWSQAIQKSPASPADEMTARDTISGEYRVSYSIERFLDADDPDLPDFAAAGSPSASDFYQFRVNNTKQFVP